SFSLTVPRRPLREQVLGTEQNGESDDDDTQALRRAKSRHRAPPYYDVATLTKSERRISRRRCSTQLVGVPLSEIRSDYAPSKGTLLTDGPSLRKSLTEGANMPAPLFPIQPQVHDLFNPIHGVRDPAFWWSLKGMTSSVRNGSSAWKVFEILSEEIAWLALR